MIPEDRFSNPTPSPAETDLAGLEVDFADEVENDDRAGHKRARTDTAVLVVDDYPPAQRLLRAQLRDLGFGRIILVSSGAEALAAMRFRTFGLILSDWKMKPMTGLGLLRAVRRDATHQAVPFLMVTVAREARMFAMAREAGANGYVVKPFTMRTLEAQIARALGEA